MENRVPLYVGSIIGWIAICTYFQYKCCTQATATSGLAVNTEIPTNVNPKEDVVLEFIEDNEPFAFDPSNFVINKPSAKETAFLIDVVEHLEQNPDRSLSINGYYGENESNNSDYEDLGLARANAIKNLMITLGVDSDRFTVESTELEDIDLEQDKLGGMFEFSFFNTSDLSEYTPDAEEQTPVDEFDDSDEVTSSVQDERPISTPAPPTTSTPTRSTPTYTPGEVLGGTNIKFEQNLYSVDDNAELIQKLKDLRTVLDQNPESRMWVIGHADNSTSAEAADLLSKQRTMFVCEMMKSHDIDMSRVVFKAYGDSRPAASNDTQEGRSKNNRVNIYIR